MHRFFLKDTGVNKKDIVMKGEEFHHLRNVLRLSIGDDVIIFDGNGNNYLASLERIDNNEALLSVKEKLEISGEAKLNIILAQGIAKGEKMDFIIQKATELGVSSIIPFVASRTVPRYKKDAVSKKTERWQKIAIEASKQCRRSIVPEIKTIMDFKEICGLDWDGYIKILLWEEADFSPLHDTFGKINTGGIKGIVIIVGPEGGFPEEEVKYASGYGFTQVRLFDRILRTETAAIAILSIVNYEIYNMVSG